MKNKEKKLKVGILFGGKNTEHEVSINSAKNIISALDKSKYELIKIKIEKSGKFNLNLLKKADVVFPVLHGPFGEDGTMQGFLKILEKPFVGPSVLGSSVSFDKDVTKRLLTEAGIPNTKFLTFRKSDKIDFLKTKKFL
ncbi:MAG: D-alanine--D-alanine ligase A, partial [Patescibacteria group bacterium]